MPLSAGVIVKGWCKATLLLMAAVLAACSSYRRTRTELATRAIEDYNLVQQDAQSILLARNILRARDRMPRHFTGLGAGQVVQSSTVRLGPLGFNDDRAPVNLSPSSAVPNFATYELFKRSLNFGVDLQSTPRIDLAALDSKEFITGMTSTVRYDILHYFQRQGWPAHQMLLLFVRELQFGSAIYRNHPGSDFFAEFLAISRRLARANLALKVGSRPPTKDEFVGPMLCLNEAAQLEHQVAAAQQGLKLYESKDVCPDGKAAWGLGKPVADNYWSFDACKMLPLQAPDRWRQDSLPGDPAGWQATMHPEDGVGLAVRSQIEAAWFSARDPGSNTQDATVDANLKTWRDALDSDEKACQPGTPCGLPTVASSVGLFETRDPGRYEALCANLAAYHALRQGRCGAAQARDGGCEPATGTDLAQVNLNALNRDSKRLLVTGKALLRSPESIIYYLGQVVRVQDRAREGDYSSPALARELQPDGFVRYWTNLSGHEESLALMSLHPLDDDESGGAVLLLDHDGVAHGITPDDTACPPPVDAEPGAAVVDPVDCDRSMSVMNSLLLLIGLQRSANELPATPTVNVIGGG